ncbi:MAG: MarR family transcriptional regulator [Patescibacteria group bacterium]
MCLGTATSADVKRVMLLMFSFGRQIGRRHESAKTSVCSHIGLHTLHFIAENENPTMNEVANYLGVAPPSATSLVDGLVKANYIERQSDQSDRRIVRLVVTEDGKNFLKTHFDIFSDTVQKSLQQLTETELKQFISILEKINQSYE